MLFTYCIQEELCPYTIPWIEQVHRYQMIANVRYDILTTYVVIVRSSVFQSCQCVEQAVIFCYPFNV